MAQIRLIATDLDGTLLGGPGEITLFKSFRDQVESIRHNSGAIWATCTGRSLSSFRLFFSPMRLMGAMPDYVVVHHAFIYRLGRFGYVPNILWNLRIRWLLWASQLDVKEAIDDWHRFIAESFPMVKTVVKKHNRLWFRFQSEVAATTAAQLLREKIKPYRHLRIFKYFQEIDIRSVPFTKGLAVSQLAGHLGIPSACVLAIGNGHNDISMLDTAVAGMTGCPSNSEPEVIQVVHLAKGHIAAGKSLEGVMEILDAHVNGAVKSDLPASWKDPEREEGPKPPKPERNRRTRKYGRTVWLILAVAYAVLLVFANYGMIPLVSDAIMKPYRFVVGILMRALMLFTR